MDRIKELRREVGAEFRVMLDDAKQNADDLDKAIEASRVCSKQQNGKTSPKIIHEITITCALLCEKKD